MRDRTIRSNPHKLTHNSQNPAKSCTILNDLLRHLIKSGLLLITKIPKTLFRLFPGYLPFKTIEKSPAFLNRSSGYKTQGVLSSLCAGLGASFRSVYFLSTSVVCFRAYRFLVQLNNMPGTKKKCRRNAEEINRGAEMTVTVSELFSQRTDRICELTKKLNR